MPIKKSELYSSLWSTRDKLRGGMDTGQYKNRVLALLLVKHASSRSYPSTIKEIRHAP